MTSLNRIELNFLKPYYSAQYEALSRDTSLRALQFKIMHRIVATNRLLFKIKISPYDLCSFCFTFSETIEHIFWECTIVKNIWFQITTELDLENKIPNFKLGPKLTILGYVEKNCHQIALNIFLAIVRQYIFRCRLDSSEPSVNGIKNVAIYRCGIHKNINNKLNFEFMHGWADL